MNPNSPALGGSGEPELTGPSGTPATASESGSTAQNQPQIVSIAPTSGTTQLVTVPSTSGTGTAATRRAIAERAREERALDFNFPVVVSSATRSNSNLNSRTTSPHKNLLSRADLEKAISLFSRMLEEPD